MHLAVFAQSLGVAQAVWRSPRTRPEHLHTAQHWIDLAKTAERGCFDAFFIADALTLSPAIQEDATVRPDPIAILGALAVSTEHIGLIGTSSTTYNDPFTVARQFATLDQLSNGRAGWNVVTTAYAAAAPNYGSTSLPDHGDRYARGEEFVDVVRALWEAWEPDAIVADRSAGVYADASRIHAIDHSGEHFQVTGPLPIPRSPQGSIPLAQAGSSGPGMRMGARIANLVFTTQLEKEASVAFVEEMRELTASFGREPDAAKILPGITPIIGKTEEEAHRLADELGAVMSERAALEFLKASFGVDLSAYEMDAPFPDVRELLPANASQGRPRLLIEMALSQGLTLRQMTQRIGLSIGHRLVVGTAEHIADDLEDWFTSGAADGFIVIPADLPLGLSDFVDGVVPLLQERGIFRSEYESAHLKGLLA